MQPKFLILATVLAAMASPVAAQTETAPTPPTVDGTTPPPPPPGGDAMAPAVGGDMAPPPPGGPERRSGKPPRNPHGGMMGMMPPPPPMSGIRVRMGQGREIDVRCGDEAFTTCLQAAMPVIDRFMAQP